LFLHNVGLGTARDPDLIERIGQVTAKEVRVTDLKWTFAPTVTVPQVKDGTIAMAQLDDAVVRVALGTPADADIIEPCR
jgi:Glycosyl hydrolase family 3 N terminal domain